MIKILNLTRFLNGLFIRPMVYVYVASTDPLVLESNMYMEILFVYSYFIYMNDSHEDEHNIDPSSPRCYKDTSSESCLRLHKLLNHKVKNMPCDSQFLLS